MILQFQNDHRWLSNFGAPVNIDDGDTPYRMHRRPGEPEFLPEGATAATAEHLYQAAKCADPEQRDTMLAAHTPGAAKRYARRVTVREDWDQVKYQAMVQVVRGKFSDEHPDLVDKLLGTGEQLLVEGNTWGDTYWGVELSTSEGENHLGTPIMRRRDELRAPVRGRFLRQLLGRWRRPRG